MILLGLAPLCVSVILLLYAIKRHADGTAVPDGGDGQ